MNIKVTLGENKKVVAEFDGYTVTTDQPKEDGGDGTAPGPFDFFLASLATCAGYFVQSFCRTRNIPTEGISIEQSDEWDEKTNLISKITVTITLPENFPSKYRSSVIAAANQCTVKRHMQSPPQMEVILN